MFLALNFFLAKRSPRRNAFLFAVATIVAYAVIDFGSLPLMGVDIPTGAMLSMGLWLVVKLLGALLGAHLGTKNRMRVVATTA